MASLPETQSLLHAMEDPFTHENHSVDLLLQQIDPEGLVADFDTSFSASASPTKPLNFPVMKPTAQRQVSDSSRALEDQEALELQRKEFNSSSDTYVSENSDKNSDHGAESPNDNFIDSFDRNFAIEANFSKTVNSHFSPAQMASQMTLNNIDEHETTERAESPTRSIMKTSASSNFSPRKSVAFPDADLEVRHTYLAPENESSSRIEEEVLSQMSHTWGEVPRNSSEENVSASPPAPPPHTSDTITSLLGSAHAHGNDDIDASSLTRYRVNHKNFSNMSLNEKLDLYLGHDHARDDLDTHMDHLDRLQNATNNETEHNIHSLTQNIEVNQPHIENPLNSLLESKEVHLRSAGSSQSSLPSLVGSNRVLDANVVKSSNSGLLLNDGIKGFPDHMADALFPETTANDSEDSGLLTFSKKPLEHPDDQESDLSDGPQGSYDHSYNSTKQSIMDLLNSASNHELAQSTNDINEPSSAPVQSGEGEIENAAPADAEISAPNPESNRLVKQENLSMVRDESPDSVKEEEVSYVKPENNSLVKSEDDSQQLAEQTDQEEELASGNLGVKEEQNSFIAAETIVKQQDSFQAQPDEEQSNERDLSPIYESDGVPLMKFEQSVEVPEAEIAAQGASSEGEEANLPQEGPSSEHEEDFNDEPLVKKEEQEINLLAQPLSQASRNFSNISDHLDTTIPDVGIASKGVKAQPHQIKLVSSPNNSLLPTPITSPHNMNFDSERMNTKDSGIEGDDEDTEDTREVLATTHHSNRVTDIMQNDSGSSSVDHFEDSSDFALGRSLPPVKINEIVDATRPPQKQEIKIAKRGLVRESDGDSSVLANSSNVNPPNDIKLPEVVTNDISFADLTERYRVSSGETAKSFEESLSAENDKDKGGLDFISIWHTQKRQLQKQTPTTSSSFYAVPSLSNYNTANLSQYDRYRLPPGLQPKKFKEVNLVSKRVFSPDHVDLNVSGFLPELSQISGLESQMEAYIKANDSTSNSFRVASRSSQMKDDTVDAIDTTSRRLPSYGTLRPVRVFSGEVITIPNTPAGPKRSKFHVPSFEIKRSNSVLSPKDHYNDIFEDVQPPTMRANGMKTLPSMERDDIKRIMQMKNTMSQEEYARLKFGGANQKIVQGQAGNFDHVQQRASFHSSALSSLKTQNEFQRRLIQAATEKSTNPLTPQSEPEAEPQVAQGLPEPEIPIKLEEDKEQSFLPDPDPEYVGFPETKDNVVKENVTPLGERSQNKLNVIPGAFVPSMPSTPKKEEKSASPVKVIISSQKENDDQPRSPIKVNASPIRLVKSGNSVTGVRLDKAHKSAVSFDGTQIVNNKLREGVDHKYKLSTVSVPSTHGDLVSEKSSTPLRVIDNEQPVGALRSGSQSRVASKTIEPPKERGKLFLRVMGLKNVSLPDLHERGAQFNITLDNGVHCIKTSNYKMATSAVYIGKEFELTVGERLEFILTMKTTYNKPRQTMKEVRERKVVKSSNKLSRMFGSKEIVTTTKFVPQEVQDPWCNIVANDGSFARCYVDLDQYADQVTGVAANFNLDCFNEWATKSGSGARYDPYIIGQLEVKMLFVPRTEQFEILPTSIKSAYESLDDLRKEKNMQLEGYLHQEGGDCESWKKRYFKLSGTNLVACSEYSHKTRAKINLAKVVEVIYVDKENMNRSSSNYRNFSDIMLVENAFKIRFANGEIIDFGAPNKEEKIKWITSIQDIVYRNKFRRQPWVKIMQKHNTGKPRPRSIMSFSS